VHRLSAGTFQALLIIELLLLALVLVWAFDALPARTTPQQVAAELPHVKQAIVSRLNGASHDPLIALSNGLTARESNVRGLALKGTVYYYYVEGRPNFDPFSRGTVAHSQVEVLLRDVDGPAPLVIYTIHRDNG
jgi:hypothetical protein